jgi:hypothetical protein
LERLKQGKYNKPHWLRYIRGHYPPGPAEKKKKWQKCGEMYRRDSTLPVSRYLTQSLYTPEYDEIAVRGGRVVSRTWSLILKDSQMCGHDEQYLE